MISVHIPSLIQEAEKGYDVRIRSSDGIFVYIQYKIADYKIRSNAKYWQNYNENYYQIKVHKMKRGKIRNSDKLYEDYNQHNLLKNLALQGEIVYYVAQNFQFIHDINPNIQFDILNKSTYIPLSDVLLPFIQKNCKSQHSITYSKNGPLNWNSIPTNLSQKLSLEQIKNQIFNKSLMKIDPLNIKNYIDKFSLPFKFRTQHLKKSKDKLTQLIFDLTEMMMIDYNVIPFLVLNDKEAISRELIN